MLHLQSQCLVLDVEVSSRGITTPEIVHGIPVATERTRARGNLPTPVLPGPLSIALGGYHDCEYIIKVIKSGFSLDSPGLNAL